MIIHVASASTLEQHGRSRLAYELRGRDRGVKWAPRRIMGNPHFGPGVIIALSRARWPPRCASAGRARASPAAPHGACAALCRGLPLAGARPRSRLITPPSNTRAGTLHRAGRVHRAGRLALRRLHAEAARQPAAERAASALWRARRHWSLQGRAVFPLHTPPRAGPLTWSSGARRCIQPGRERDSH